MKTKVQTEKGCRIKKSKLKRQKKKDPIEQGNKRPNRKGILKEIKVQIEN